jgi:hypothetical protein
MSDWQPIETAPKDGTRIIAVVAGYHICVGVWVNKAWCYFDASDFFSEGMWERYQRERAEAGASWEPTHWMPLPAPPQKEE